jgi:hypothetical protein
MFGNYARCARVLACLAACLALALAAQASPAATGRGLGFAYDRTHEITIVGTVQQLATASGRGEPAGLHLLVSSSGKVVDAHVGPYLSRENQRALGSGQLVQITGVREAVQGKSILVARQIIFNGRVVTIRNERGFLVRNLTSRRKPAGLRTASSGGAQ